MRRWMHLFGLLCCGVFVMVPGARGAETVDDLLASAKAALDSGQADLALALTNKAIDQEPKIARSHVFRGLAHEALRKNSEALADYDRAVALDAQLAEAYNHRGAVHFKLGHIKESLVDFDRFLELRPKARAAHWQRGITCYYAGQYDEGRKQFEAGALVYGNDVENAAWHFLCVARLDGLDKARQSLLKIGTDSRVPLMVVYALYQCKAKPDDVLTAAHAGKPAATDLNERLFYAHLYLGLYDDVAGNKKQAEEHLKKAVEDYKIGHYMWDVAHVHLDLLRKEKAK